MYKRQEVDGIHGTNDRGGVRAIGDIIKKAKHPMILIANDFYSKRIASLKTKCDVLKMSKVRSPSINKLLKQIAINEGIKANPAALKELAKKSNGDMRSAINTFQALANQNEVLELSDIENITTKDDRSTIINGVTAVLKSKNPNHVKKALMVEAKRILDSERATTVQEATEQVGISRSSFYKYKDDIFPFHDQAKGRTVTFILQMDDKPGILSDILRTVAEFRGNILTIHQSIPINGIATLTLSVEILPEAGDAEDMIGQMEQQTGVHYLKILGRE